MSSWQRRDSRRPHGVRQLFKTLRNGEAVVILPDQAPGEGGGVWAPPAKPAYMTLLRLNGLSRLTQPCCCFMVSGCRSAWLQVHIQPLQGNFSGEAQSDAALLNRNLESMIRDVPAQYLWSYNRYKVPAGVTRRWANESRGGAGVALWRAISHLPTTLFAAIAYLIGWLLFSLAAG